MPALARQLIIDTDAGADDLLALHLVFSTAAKRIKAVIGSYGNFSLDGSMERLETFIPHWQKTFPKIPLPNFPVIAGSTQPFNKPYTEYEGHIHGPSPLNPKTRNNSWKEKLFGPQWVTQLEEFKGHFTYVSLGPLTNLATLTTKPIWGKISDIVIMGGALFFPGNATPAAEANIWWDPEAFERVVRAANASNKPVYLIPLNMTEKVQLTHTEAKKKNLLTLIPGLKEYIQFYVKVKKQYLDPQTLDLKLYLGAALHDVVAMKVAIKGVVKNPKEVYLTPEFLPSGLLLPIKPELSPDAPRVFLP